MKNKLIKTISIVCAAFPLLLTGCKQTEAPSIPSGDRPGTGPLSPTLKFSFDEIDGSYTVDSATGKQHRINYVFAKENQADLFKKYNDNIGITPIYLSSTSPANAQKRLEDLIEEWKIIIK